jgi:hypothetical protein
MTKVIVCGGRGFYETAFIWQHLDILNSEYNFSELIHGDAKGVDRIAGYWAESRSVDCKKYPADWDTYRSSAGPIRNNQMLKCENPDLVVAFPGNVGTNHMIKIAKNAGVEVVEIKL